MAHFYGGALPMHRQLKGLLLRGLPRSVILARGGRGITASSCRPLPTRPERRG